MWVVFLNSLLAQFGHSGLSLDIITNSSNSDSQLLHLKLNIGISFLPTSYRNKMTKPSTQVLEGKVFPCGSIF